MTLSPAPSSSRGRVPLKLGLIGDNIRESRAPALHRLAGRLNGFDVTYDLLIPAELGLDFDTLFGNCRGAGFRGLNITLPYKERVLAQVTVDDPFIRSIGSVNTVVFELQGPVGHNTDYSGFMAAYRGCFGTTPPGTVVLVGAGGVGRAISFALAMLGARGVRIVDSNLAKAGALAQALRTAFRGLAVETPEDAASAMKRADGVVNCTPLGMSGYPGSAVPRDALAGCNWAFDAVYTPVETQLKRDCEHAGVAFLSGYELFFHQGVDAFRIFSGSAIEDLDGLRAGLNDPAA